jgi:cysteine desulfurase
VFHVDAAQASGKLPIDLEALPIDLMSVCAHKIYGPKGVGALFVRRQPDWVLPPLIHGGGHERGMRSGTLPTHQIAGMGLAFELAGQRFDADRAHVETVARLFSQTVLQEPSIRLNGDPARKLPGILNLSFSGLDVQVLMSSLPGLALSSGSACTSASLAPSHVLHEMGLSDEQALNSLRFSFGRFSTPEEAAAAAEQLLTVSARLRA